MAGRINLMAKELSRTDRAIVRLADGTVKQQNLLTGTEVWTVPGRGHRPLSVPPAHPMPIDHDQDGCHCAFCDRRYLETPPEKSRLVRDQAGNWSELTGLPADQLSTTTAEFRRIPNLFEIVSYNYWHLNHGHVPSEAEHRRMAEYLASSEGYDHVMRVVHARLSASGVSDGEIDAMSDSDKLQQANGFFSGGHDLIVARRHYIDGAKDTTQLAGSGTMTPEEHFQYTAFTTRTMADLYTLDPNVRYVAAFQNWLKPAGASFDHLHKQLVAIDDFSVQTEAELNRLRSQPDIYDDILTVAATRKLLIAQNDHAIAMAGFGHRFPGVAIWPPIPRAIRGKLPKSNFVPFPTCCTRSTLRPVPMFPATKSGIIVRPRFARRCGGGSCSSGAFRRWQVSRAAHAFTSTHLTRGTWSTAWSRAWRKCVQQARSLR